MDDTNAPEKVDGRIDRLLAQGLHDGADPVLLLMIDRIYRPFCHAMVEMEQAEVDAREVRLATAYLIANLIDEIVGATAKPRNHASVAQAMVEKVGAILARNKKTKPPTLS